MRKKSLSEIRAPYNWRSTIGFLKRTHSWCGFGTPRFFASRIKTKARALLPVPIRELRVVLIREAKNLGVKFDC